MATTADILTALFARVATAPTGSPTLAIVWPEQAETFTPPSSGKYLAVSVFTNRPAYEGITAGKIDQGLLQVSVVWPKNQGLIAPAAVADIIKAHFAKGTILTSGGAKVKISGEPWAAAPLTDPDRVTIPVTIPWTA